MTENEKKLLQAKHRLEEAQMRDRVKERKARTHRLIQEGAILEKALPQTTQMTLEQLEDFYGKYSRRHDDFRRSGKPGRFSFSPKGALTHHLQNRRWYPSLRSGSCALHELSFSHFSRGGRQCRRRTFPVQSALCFAQSAKRCGCILPPYPAVCLRNLPPAALSQRQVCRVFRHTYFLF